MLTEGDSDPATGTLSMTAKGRGLADCGMAASWMRLRRARRLADPVPVDAIAGPRPAKKGGASAIRAAGRFERQIHWTRPRRRDGIAGMGVADRYHAAEEQERAAAIARLPLARRLLHQVDSVLGTAAILLALMLATGSAGPILDLRRWLAGP